MKIATIIGARPQFIKAAVISRAIEEHNLHNSSPVIEKSVKSGDMMLHRVPIFPIPRGLFRHHRPRRVGAAPAHRFQRHAERGLLAGSTLPESIAGITLSHGGRYP